jgi:hypothetical protein
MTLEQSAKGMHDPVVLGKNVRKSAGIEGIAFEPFNLLTHLS